RVLNPRTGKRERLRRIYRMYANKRDEEVQELVPGDIVGIVGLEHTITGDTLCDIAKPVLLEHLDFPDTVISMAVEPKSQAEKSKLIDVLDQLTKEDPTLRWQTDPDTGQVVLSGMGELHLEVVRHRMDEEFSVNANFGSLRVAYKETIKGRGDTKYRHKKQTGGAGQFAEVWMHVQRYTPGAEDAEGKGKKELIELPWGGKFLFVDEVVGGHIPAQLVQSVKKGFLSALESGVLAGHPMIGVTATVYDGKTHPVDSKDIAFQIAGRQGFKECARAAQPVLMEPIMNVEITVPTDAMGAITGDLNSRRGRVLGMSPDGSRQKIRAQVPMAEMLKYTPELRSLTGGKGIFTMEMEGYEEVPAMIAQKVIAQAQKEKGEE
ncbi:MAG: elongation factor G, partial [Candidatus Erginobacter occultus]|nr:elongation factor G [Candidatus Erginobacter occultus]